MVERTWIAPQWYNRLSQGYLLAILCVPLVPPIGGYPLGQATKALWLFITTVVYLLLFLLIPIGLKLQKKPISMPKFRWDIPTALLLCYLGCCLISAFSSAYPTFAFYGQGTGEGFFTLALYGFICLVAKNWGMPSKRFLWPVMLYAAVNFVLIFAQWLGYNPFQLYGAGMTFYDGYEGYHGQFLGTTGSVTATGLCFAWIAIGALFYLLYHKKSLSALALVAQGLWVVWLCAVDGVYLALLSGVCILLLGKCLGKNGQIPSVKKLLVSLLGLGLGCVALVYVLPIENGMFGQLHQLLHGDISGSFGSSRIEIWQESWTIFTQHPIWGIGPATYRQYSTIIYSRYVEAYDWVKMAHVETAHNDFLNILVSTGVFSLVAYVLFLGATLKALSRSIPKTGKLWLLALLGCYCVHGFFTFSAVAVSPIFWILLGFASQCATTPSIDNTTA